MKLLVFPVLYSLLVVLIFGITSCNRYLDKTTTEKKIPVMQGMLTFYPDSNVLVYKSSIGLKADNEIQKPKPFYVKLPKGIKWYVMENSQSFAFYYKTGQVIAIEMDLSNNVAEKNTIYQPTSADIEKYRTAFTADVKQRYNIWNIEYLQNRKQLMIKKGAATILLYNILPSNYDQFRSFLEGIKFI